MDGRTDTALKSRQRTMWGSGDYPAMVDRFLSPLGPRLVEACGIEAGMRVLDVAAGAGNASLPAAATGAEVTASDLTPDLLEVGRARAAAAGLELDWVEADAERLPFGDGSFDIVMSSIGVMFAPHHRAAADELLRVCRPGGTIGLLSWTPNGMVGALFRMMRGFASKPLPGTQPPPLWGGESHVARLFGDRVEQCSVQHHLLEVTAFDRPCDFAEHLKEHYGLLIAARAKAERDGRAEALDGALDVLCQEWDRGGAGGARFEMEYLLTVGQRR